MKDNKKLYTLLVYSENIAGILNQITAVFTRRQVNIESLNVSASSIEGVHKYTITAWSDEDQIIKITKQIEKKIDVVKANYFTDDQLFMLRHPDRVGFVEIAPDRFQRLTVSGKQRPGRLDQFPFAEPLAVPFFVMAVGMPAGKIDREYFFFHIRFQLEVKISPSPRR